MRRQTLPLFLVPLTISLALLSTGMSTFAAAPKLSAQSIIVNPIQTDLRVGVSTDKDQSGTQIPSYSTGERIRLFVTVNQDAYVYLFNVDPIGKVNLILPNHFADGANYLRAGTVKVFPSSQDQFVFDITAPYGRNKVLALASRTQLNLNDIAKYQDQSSQSARQGGFAITKVTGEQQLAQALSIVINPVPQTSWVSAVALYDVLPRPVNTTPVNPGNIQVVPIPQRPQPQPLPNYGFPVINLGEESDWETSFRTDHDATEVYRFYAADLTRQGYRQLGSESDKHSLTGTFQKGDQRVVLEVREKGKSGKFDVSVKSD